MLMSSRGPLPTAFAPFAFAAEPLYRFVVGRRNRAFDQGKRVSQTGVPVISIGNLSVGGTGKTPMVMHAARELRDLWKSPGIAMRGYAAKQGKPSDEQAEYADRLPGVPVVANPDRVAGIKSLVKKHQVDCAILDDGFQHRFVARDLDIVLIDATQSPFDDRCLPAGWLREPVASLARADAIVITRADRVDAHAIDRLRSHIERATGKPPTAITSHAWDGLVSGDDGNVRDVSSLKGTSVVLACAIGNPDALAQQLESTGADVRTTVAQRDHHDWSSHDANHLGSLLDKHRADSLIVTHKDWVKLREVIPESSELRARILYPRLGIHFIEGADA